MLISTSTGIIISAIRFVVQEIGLYSIRYHGIGTIIQRFYNVYRREFILGNLCFQANSSLSKVPKEIYKETLYKSNIKEANLCHREKRN